MLSAWVVPINSRTKPKVVFYEKIINNPDYEDIFANLCAVNGQSTDTLYRLTLQPFTLLTIEVSYYHLNYIPNMTLLYLLIINPRVLRLLIVMKQKTQLYLCCLLKCFVQQQNTKKTTSAAKPDPI